MAKEMAKKPITGLFYDEGYEYLSTIEPTSKEPITFRLRAVKDNVTKAELVLSNDKGETWQRFPMKKDGDDRTGYFEFFKVTVPAQKLLFKYLFYCENEDPANATYYCKEYYGKEIPALSDDPIQTDSQWCLVPDHHTPDWAKGTIWYSIMPDCFYNGDPTNDEDCSGANLSNSWNHCKHMLDDKFGGDCRGIEKMGHYVKDLGCESIFFNPFFKSFQNACYGPEFYKQIENSFGNRQALIRMGNRLHELGLHYVVDVVFSFNEHNSIWYDKEGMWPFPTAAHDWNNKYHDFFWFTGEKGDCKSYRGLWGGIELNHANKELAKELYSGEDAYLPYIVKTYNFDGFRYDTGGALYGEDENGKRIGDPDVVSKMRPYLRALNPEFFMFSEYSIWKAIQPGTAWDCRWNIDFVHHTRSYVMGETKPSRMKECFDLEILGLPRTAALCEYTSACDHDHRRTEYFEDWQRFPLWIMIFSLPCAPCFYYGDEFNINRDSIMFGSFYAMEWDESNWDYQALNMSKALVELRKTQSCIRKGIFKYVAVDDDANILSFARMDENGTAIAVCNHNPTATTMSINVRELGEPDGTLFTDWLTGKQYVAENGYIYADIIAGGTVIVRGDQSSTYKCGYEVSKIGESEATVLGDGLDAFTVSGTGTFGAADAYTFVNRDAFNACGIAARLDGKKNDVALLIREDLTADAVLAGAYVKGDRLFAVTRKTKGGAVKKTLLGTVAPHTYVRVSRDGTNEFSVETTMTVGTPWQKAASFHVDLSNRVKVGFAALGGTSKLTDIVLSSPRAEVLFDDFKHGVSAMFDRDASEAHYTKNGLTLVPVGDRAEWLTNGPDDDWTFKTEFKGNGEYAGVISKQDDDNYVVAGRKVEDGKPVFFLGRATNGVLLTYFSVPDTKPNAKATVQLQRVGTTYGAVCSYDGANWQQIGYDLIANYSRERIGLVTVGGEATYRYASFGNAVEDGASSNTPRTVGTLKADTPLFDDVQKNPHYRIVSGDWEYANEGYIQKSTEAAQMGIENKKHKYFKVHTTFVVEKGKGYIGFEFAKKAHNTPMGDGIQLLYDNKAGLVRLVKEGTTLAEAAVAPEEENALRLCAIYRDDVFTLFAGLDATPVMQVKLIADAGYIAYVMKGVVAHINSEYVGSEDSTWAFHYPHGSSNDGIENKWIHTFNFISRQGVAYTDYVMRVTVRPLEFWDGNSDQFAAVCLAEPEHANGRKSTLSVRIRRNNQLQLMNDKEVVGRASYKNKDHVDLLVVKQGKKTEVYVDYATPPALTFTEKVVRGGAISFSTQYVRARYEKFEVLDLNPGADAKETALWKAWTK